MLRFVVIVCFDRSDSDEFQQRYFNSSRNLEEETKQKGNM
jgi:hypothetical protein